MDCLRLVYKGSLLSVWALVRDGICKATDFLNAVDSVAGRKKERGEPRIRSRYLRLIKKLAEGQRLERDEGHSLDPKKPPGDAAKGIFEFKDNSSQTRLLSFQGQIGYVLTHGITGKKENELPVTEVNRANADRQWYLAQLARSSTAAGIRGKP